MNRIRKCLLVLAIILTALLLSHVQYGNAASVVPVQGSAIDNCSCQPCQFQSVFPPGSDEYYAQKWRIQDSSWNVRNMATECGAFGQSCVF